jgi:hypothetical protein
VGNGGVGNEGRGTARRGRVGAAGDRAQCGGSRGSARCGMAAVPRGGLRRADDALSRVEQSEELGISIGCRIVDGVDRGESVYGTVGPVTVMERARSRTSVFYKKSFGV